MKVEFEIVTLEWKNVNADFFNLPKTSGIYQIYGDSPIYGQNQLLYIGKAANLFDRINNGHLANENSFITRQPNKSYRYANVESELISIVEEILIIMHKPSFNSSSLINVSDATKSSYYYIQNHGERGMLHLEVSNFYFLPFPSQI